MANDRTYSFSRYDAYWFILTLFENLHQGGRMANQAAEIPQLLRDNSFQANKSFLTENPLKPTLGLHLSCHKPQLKFHLYLIDCLLNMLENFKLS